MSRVADPVKVELWRDRLARCNQSELTTAEFCLAEGVTTASFYAWRRRLGLAMTVTERFKTSHVWALQNQPVNCLLLMGRVYGAFLGVLFLLFGIGPGGRFGWFWAFSIFLEAGGRCGWF